LFSVSLPHVTFPPETQVSLLRDVIQVASAVDEPGVVSRLLYILGRLGPVPGAGNDVVNIQIETPVRNPDFTYRLIDSAKVVPLALTLEVLEDPMLSGLHRIAIRGLFEILRSVETAADTLVDQILPRLAAPLVIRDIRLLLTICKDRIKPLVPAVIDVICDGWCGGELPDYVEAISVLAEQAPQLFAPFVEQVTEMIVIEFPLSPAACEAVVAIFQKFKTLIRRVDHLVIPAILRLIREAAADDKFMAKLLVLLGRVLLHADFGKHVVNVLHAVLRIKAGSTALQSGITDILGILFAQMGEPALR
jgi:hypothetical protein